MFTIKVLIIFDSKYCNGDSGSLLSNHFYTLKIA